MRFIRAPPMLLLPAPLTPASTWSRGAEAVALVAMGARCQRRRLPRAAFTAARPRLLPHPGGVSPVIQFRASFRAAQVVDKG